MWATPNTGQNHQLSLRPPSSEAGILFQFQVIRCWGWFATPGLLNLAHVTQPRRTSQALGTNASYSLTAAMVTSMLSPNDTVVVTTAYVWA